MHETADVARERSELPESCGRQGCVVGFGEPVGRLAPGRVRAGRGVGQVLVGILGHAQVPEYVRAHGLPPRPVRHPSRPVCVHRLDGANTSRRFWARCGFSSTRTAYAPRSTAPWGTLAHMNTARRRIHDTNSAWISWSISGRSMPRHLDGVGRRRTAVRTRRPAGGRAQRIRLVQQRQGRMHRFVAQGRLLPHRRLGRPVVLGHQDLHGRDRAGHRGMRHGLLHCCPQRGNVTRPSGCVTLARTGSRGSPVRTASPHAPIWTASVRRAGPRPGIAPRSGPPALHRHAQPVRVGA
jgi:hypothetical protein